MRHSDLAAAALSLLLFGFLALMAWTGKLVGIDGSKFRIWLWIVEDAGVGNFGRTNAAVLFATLGLLAVPAVLLVRRRLF